METLIVQPKNQKQLAAMEAVLKALNVTFNYDPAFVAKIEKSRAEAKAGKVTSIKPADIWNLG